MRSSRGQVVQVETLDDLDRRVGRGATSLGGWRVRGLDLTGRSELLHRLDLSGATFLACTFAPGDAERAQQAGALVLPALSVAPVDVYRSRLYRPDELYDTVPYAGSLDARAYAWSQTPATGGADTAARAEDALARALHDHAVDEALQAWVPDRHLVGVMGGHAAARGDASYVEAARLGHALGPHLTVTTGGGPGAMEAANLGALLSRAPLDALRQAVDRLAAVPSFRPSVDFWLAPALEVAAAVEDPVDSLGIPTWHYGHEPSNVFATAVAKYFRNATREAILLDLCDAGIVFLPGAGGTVQEIFQDACENYYADESSVADMVLVGRTWWTETLPAWPLLQSLARGRVMESHVHLVETAEEAAALLVDRAAGRSGPQPQATSAR